MKEYNFLRIKMMRCQLYSSIPLKRNSHFMRYLFIGYCPVNGLKTLYIDIKPIELLKKQIMFQVKMEDFKCNQSKN